MRQEETNEHKATFFREHDRARRHRGARGVADIRRRRNEDKSCYGLSAADLGPQLPPQPHSTSLTKREIEVLADHILATYKGR
jgi:hypothetical protein